MSISSIPADFVYLSAIDPTIIQSIRYFGHENFVGRRIDGYNKSTVILTQSAAVALKQAQNQFNKDGFTIVVYDAYRPQTAVDDFIRWSKDHNDILQKDSYYPRVDKEKVFDLGYVAEKSGHSRGSTVDISIMALGNSLQQIKIHKRKLNDNFQILCLDDGTVDMGSSFDLFDIASHFENDIIPDNYKHYRHYLKSVMKSHGFENYPNEWWHYTLVNEPYPRTYFDFAIE